MGITPEAVFTVYSAFAKDITTSELHRACSSCVFQRKTSLF